MSGAVAPILAKCWEQFGVDDTSLGLKAKYPGNHCIKSRNFERDKNLPELISTTFYLWL